MGFGALRVMNDDLVQPQTGFDTHSHKNMEIISYVLNGSITHCDTLDSNDTISRGEVQYFSAGNGIYHSEYNYTNDITRLIQIWIKPNILDTQPLYQSHKYKYTDRLNKISHLCSGNNIKYNNIKAPINVKQDCNIYSSEMDSKDNMVNFELKEDRKIYLVCLEGECNINDDIILNYRDVVKIWGYANLNIISKGTGNPSSHILMVELPQNDP